MTRPVGRPRGDGAVVHVRLRLERELLDRCDRAAAARGLDLSRWIREIALLAVTAHERTERSP